MISTIFSQIVTAEVPQGSVLIRLVILPQIHKAIIVTFADDTAVLAVVAVWRRRQKSIEYRRKSIE